MTAEQDLIQNFWDEHVAWSEVANGLKSSRTWWRRVVLSLTILGAALETIAATTHSSQAGIAGTIALALVPFITANLLTPASAKKWLRSRSISEGIKSEVYAYLANGELYSTGEALETLRKKVTEIRKFGDDMTVERAAVIFQKKAPPPAGTDAYIVNRVRNQIDKYYLPNAQENATRASQFLTAEIVLAGVTAVLSAAATYYTAHPTGVGGTLALGPWVAVLTTVGGSIAAYAAASRYEFQATTYYATARQLEDLLNGWRLKNASVPSGEWYAFVHGCEEAISAENRSWMAKLDATR